MAGIRRKVIVLFGCAALTGCVGLGAPIGTRVPDGLDKPGMNAIVESYGDYYEDPRRLALWRIAQWDRAIANIQGGNTAANLGLAGTAAALGYRAARDMSKAATIGLAAGGLFGMSATEALVQVSRINVYSAGISGMECALAAYGQGLPSHEPASDPLALSAAVANDWPMYQDIVRIRAESELNLDEGMLLAVSRISRQVDAALMGSFVSATSRASSWSGSFSAAIQPLPQGAKGNLVADQEQTPPSAQITAARAALAKGLAEARAYAHSVQARRHRMDACDIDGATATAERIGTAFGIDLLGGSEPLTVQRGSNVSFRVVGGVPPYSVVVADAPENGPKLGIDQTSGIGVVTARTTDQTEPGTYQLIVADSAGAPARKVQLLVEQ